MKAVALLVLLNLVTLEGYSQFWVGPTVGGQLTTHKYTEPKRTDTFDIASDFNWHAGVVMEYQTGGVFAVHTEITYMQFKTKTTSSAPAPMGDPGMYSNATHRFLTVPMLARAQFGRGAVKFFVNAGPRLSYWLGSNGTVYTSEFEANAVEPIDYKVAFGDFGEFANSTDDFQVIEKPNRLQYSLDFGTGVLIDITDEQRILVDVRYSFGHSIMAFNSGNAFNNIPQGQLSDGGYTEDMEYKNSMIMFSVGYLFGYSPSNQRKGSSTIRRKK